MTDCTHDKRRSDRTAIDHFAVSDLGWVFYAPDATPDAWIQTDTTERVAP